jgi:ATP-dependent DNA helicase RecG
MEEANLSPPSFDSDREDDQFTATFLMHHFLDEQDIAWLAHFTDAGLTADEARILIHARELGFVNNSFCRYYTRLDTLAASGILRKLRDLGLLEQHSRGSATYYTPTERLLHPETKKIGTSDEKPHEKQLTLSEIPNELEPSTKPTYKPTTHYLPTLPTNLTGLPANLQEIIENLGQRNPPAHVQNIITELCRIRAFTADELAEILNRNKSYVFRTYLAPLIRDGVLEYTIPDNIHHPNQAYKTTKQGGTS